MMAVPGFSLGSMLIMKVLVVSVVGGDFANRSQTSRMRRRQHCLNRLETLTCKSTRRSKYDVPAVSTRHRAFPNAG